MKGKYQGNTCLFNASLNRDMHQKQFNDIDVHGQLAWMALTVYPVFTVLLFYAQLKVLFVDDNQLLPVYCFTVCHRSRQKVSILREKILKLLKH